MNMQLHAIPWCCLALCACGGAVRAQAPVPKIREKMTENLNGTPDFVCSESIQRSERTGGGAPVAEPPLQVEAGVIAGKELYRSPASEADTTRLRAILSFFSRAGTGSFALYSRAVFVTADGSFYDMPQESQNGRKLLREDFAMPREGSRYFLSTASGPVTLGYSGTLWTDPDSLQLISLALQADNIPKDLGIKAITQTLDFAPVTLAEAARLLPAATEILLQESSGREVRVTGRFSGCRPYVPQNGDHFLNAENEGSVVITTEKETRKEAPAPEPAPAADLLPPNTRFDTVIHEAIDERTTKEDSRLTFTIIRDIKVHGKILVPRGSTGTAHVTRITLPDFVLYTSVKRYYLVGLQFDSIMVNNQAYPVRANLENVGEPAKGTAFIPYSHDPDKWGNFEDIYQLLLTPPPQPGESFLGIVREFLRLSGNMRMYWSTQPPQIEHRH